MRFRPSHVELGAAVPLLLFLATSLAPLVGQPPRQLLSSDKHALPPLGHFGLAITLVDVDRDGDPDVLSAGTDGRAAAQRCRLYLNDGRGVFSEATATQMPDLPLLTQALATGDLDGDGDPDLVLGNGTVNVPMGTAVFINDGKGKFTDESASRIGYSPLVTGAVALGDIDGDSDLDLMVGVTGFYGGQDRLFLNDGKGKFTDVTATHLPSIVDSTRALVLADLDRDGDLDVVVGNANPASYWGKTLILENDGRGRFQAAPWRGSFPTDLTESVAAGDVDGDRDLDLVLGNGALLLPQQDRLFLNNGSGYFTEAANLPNAVDDTNHVLLADVDADGDADLLKSMGWAPWTPASLLLYLNDGKGRFVDASTTRVAQDGVTSAWTAAGDVDGDEDLDLVVAKNSFAAAVPDRLLVNLHRHVLAPEPARTGFPYPVDIHARPGYGSGFTLAIPFVGAREGRIVHPRFGTFGLDAATTVVLSLVVIGPAQGVARVPLVLPADPRLAGGWILAQALLIPDLADPPQGWRFTNVLAERLR